jgi:DNA recombination protein RmuC
MFLPTDGLYAEVLRQPQIVEDMQRKYHTVVAGPTTLAAILNSLRMGFRTLAIEQRAGEVWKTLAAVKTEFGKFGEILDSVKKQLQTACNTLEQTSTRSRAMERKLKEVEQLPATEAAGLLGLDSAQAEIADESETEELPEKEGL